MGAPCYVPGVATPCRLATGPSTERGPSTGGPRVILSAMTPPGDQSSAKPKAGPKYARLASCCFGRVDGDVLLVKQTEEDREDSKRLRELSIPLAELKKIL